jgi:two-component system, NtrC family, sensor kinase
MTQVDPHWRSAVLAHLQEQNEASLSRAYELGREALGRGLGVMDIFSLYSALQAEIVLPEVHDQARVAAALNGFFSELLSAYEMAFRGYREANSQLERANENLTAAYAELQQKQLQLIHAAKMASLGELVAGVAHEVNNPLAFIASHLRTVSAILSKIEADLGSAVLPSVQANLSKARDRLQESELGTERIRDLVLKLRTFSRLDEGERKKVSIKDCVGSVLTILEHKRTDRIQVRTHFGYPDLIECYPSLLNQAIMNLVSNAIDAIGAVEHGGSITITTGADVNHYVIAITDSGCGIPEHLRERVFEPFFTTKGVGEGTGLGLSITDSIVRKHGGMLELSDRQGGGTIATIRIPLTSSLNPPL